MLLTANGNEPAPPIFYIFVGGLNPATKHNFSSIGQFVSAGFIAASSDASSRQRYLDGTATYLPFVPAEPSCKFISPYLMTAISDYRVEYDAERFRLRRHATYPSRISSIYAFGNMEACKTVAEKYGWSIDTVAEFSLAEHPLTRVVKVNMEIVSVARAAYRMSALDEVSIDRIWESYWGAAEDVALEVPVGLQERRILRSDVVWEYLIEGQVIRQ